MKNESRFATILGRSFPSGTPIPPTPFRFAQVAAPFRILIPSQCQVVILRVEQGTEIQVNYSPTRTRNAEPFPDGEPIDTWQI